jgi:hypothetical protein
MIIYSIYKKNYPVTPSKQVVNVFDLGYVEVEKDFHEQISSLPYRKKKNNELSPKKKKNTTKVIQKRE